MTEAIRKALIELRQRRMSGEVAVVFDRETGGNGLDGRRWRFFATDGDRVVPIEAELSGSENCKLSRVLDRVSLETAVERRLNGGYHRREWRLAEVAADGAINLRAEDVRPRRKIASAFV